MSAKLINPDALISSDRRGGARISGDQGWVLKERVSIDHSRITSKLMGSDISDLRFSRSAGVQVGSDGRGPTSRPSAARRSGARGPGHGGAIAMAVSNFALGVRRSHLPINRDSPESPRWKNWRHDGALKRDSQERARPRPSGKPRA